MYSVSMALKWFYIQSCSHTVWLIGSISDTSTSKTVFYTKSLMKTNIYKDDRWCIARSSFESSDIDLQKAFLSLAHSINVIITDNNEQLHVVLCKTFLLLQEIPKGCLS